MAKKHFPLPNSAEMYCFLTFVVNSITLQLASERISNFSEIKYANYVYILYNHLHYILQGIDIYNLLMGLDTHRFCILHNLIHNLLYHSPN